MPSGSDAYLRAESWLTAWTAVVAAGFFLIVRSASNREAPGRDAAPPPAESFYWAALAVLSVFMMLPPSAPIWKMLPPLQAIQFPSRLNVLLMLSVAALSALAMGAMRRIRDRRTTLLAAGTFLLVIGWTLPIARSMSYQGPWIGAGTAVNLDYLITSWAQWTDPKLVSLRGIPLPANATQVAVDGGTAIVEKWQPRAIAFRIATAESWVPVKQFYFPGLARRGPGRPYSAGSRLVAEGLVEIRVPAAKPRSASACPTEFRKSPAP